MVMDEQSSTKGIFKKLINMYKLEYFTETTQVAMSEEWEVAKKASTENSDGVVMVDSSS